VFAGDDLPPRLRRKPAAEYLFRVHGIEVAPATLAKFVCTGGGPVVRYAGRVPLYEISELDRWAAARLGPRRRSTSDPG
jgi:hypothetical protein